MRKFRVGSRKQMAIVGAAALSTSSTAFAQSSEQLRPDSQQEAQPSVIGSEIVVTATRRAVNAQNVGISISAFSGAQLQALGVTQSTDIVAQVPGLKMNQFSPAITVFNIRGVSQNDFADHLEPPIATYIDDAYIAIPGAVGVPAFDLERVEVLRGPQGTLFGRNATGGLIHFISKRPTKAMDGYASLIVGSHGNVHPEFAIGGPISDFAQVRFSAAYNGRSPYVKNLTGRDVIGGENNVSLRGQLALQPGDSLDVLLIGRYSRNDDERTGGYVGSPTYPDADGLGALVPNNVDIYGTCPGCDLFGYKPSGKTDTVSLDTPGTFHRTIAGGQARFELNLGSVAVTSISDYMHMTKGHSEDSDGTPNPIFIWSPSQDFAQFSQELRLAGKAQNFRWTAGFYYLNWHSTQDSLFRSPAFGFDSGFDAHLKTESWSVFAQGEYDLTGRLTAILGGRYVEDRKKIDYRFADTLGDTLVVNSTTNAQYAAVTMKDYALRAELDYKFAERVLGYASFNRGIKGGNFATPAFAPVTPSNIPHRPETLYSYEAGVKSTFADGKVRLNLGGFYYDYKDYQAFFFRGLAGNIGNLNATAYGLEAELTTNPLPGFDIITGLSLMKSKVKDVTLPSGRIVDRRLPQAPSVSGNFLVHYEHGLTDALDGSVQFDVNYVGKQSFTVLSAPFEGEKAYTVGNIRAGIAPPSKNWEVAAFVHNLWNQRYRVYALDVSSAGFGDSIYAEPRWYGISVMIKFCD